MPVGVVWMTAFLDLPASSFAEGADYWCGLTRTQLSEPRGDQAEFTTFVPADGDPFLKAQRTTSGAVRVHLDLHVADLDGATEAAESLGARVTARPPHGYVVLASPAGVVFCLVREPLSRRPGPETWPGGRSLLDQVCLDIADADYATECRFWADLTGWDLRDGSTPEFAHLVRPDGQPWRVLLQRVGDGRQPATAHLDLASDDRTAEVERHQRLGGVVLRRHDHFTVLRDPSGLAYCVTDRDVETGLLQGRPGTMDS